MSFWLTPVSIYALLYFGLNFFVARRIEPQGKTQGNNKCQGCNKCQG